MDTISVLFRAMFTVLSQDLGILAWHIVALKYRNEYNNSLLSTIFFIVFIKLIVDWPNLFYSYKLGNIHSFKYLTVQLI